MTYSSLSMALCVATWLVVGANAWGRHVVRLRGETRSELSTIAFYCSLLSAVLCTFFVWS